MPFGPSKGAQEVQEAGWRLAMDFKGPLKPDLYGNIWQMQIVETQSRYGGVYGLPSKHAEGSVKGMLLYIFLANLRRLLVVLAQSGDRVCYIISDHVR